MSMMSQKRGNRAHGPKKGANMKRSGDGAFKSASPRKVTGTGKLNKGGRKGGYGS